MKIPIFRKLFSDEQVELALLKMTSGGAVQGIMVLTQIATSILCWTLFVTSGPQCWDFCWDWCSSSAFSLHVTALQCLPLTDS